MASDSSSVAPVPALPRTGAPALESAPSKLAEQVARRLEDKIVELGWPVGEVIGSEPDLLAEFGISRAIFREAVRLLEHHSVARMRRGPGGGLVVTTPNTSSVVRAAALHLQFDHATPRDVFEARSALELKIVELATEKIDEDGIRLLRATLDQEAAIQASDRLGTHDVHLVIADLTGNPAMRLFLEVLTKLTVPRTEGVEEVRKRGRHVRHAHDRIVEAIVAGDVALARHRMQSHLLAMSRYLAHPGTSGEHSVARPGLHPAD
ncbi:FadR/GntR family transcriptional regulator [Amycolatopsis thermophila]|uniref:DNA-binding FadR family transcriptional regulator n=1 Tax=Amycolatopsis thermophila TaxID=206084 RepID=A0ABU0F5G0_9PSEU|nr:FCD domain-containing protein [Amycolatopsis thermophila]MDQ0382796.1 DNA-binding FadR family transcriptional regulator [Amycolatopsis thermophila]